jgi:predicted flap endonuclease-1-like 5' DNA nuclease
MSTWSVLTIFIVVVLIVWWALTRNAKTYKPDFEVHPHAEAHPVEEKPALAVEEGQAVEEEQAPAPVETEAVVAPVKLVETAPTEPLKPDDLTVKEGIGPKVN